jgi:hypothetical protein
MVSLFCNRRDSPVIYFSGGSFPALLAAADPAIQKEDTMHQPASAAGSFTFPGTALTVNRMGYGAMQLAGKDGDKLVWGPPADEAEAVAVLQAALAGGVNHVEATVRGIRRLRGKT